VVIGQNVAQLVWEWAALVLLKLHLRKDKNGIVFQL
jgi:hypothetical protein